jgi:hypothetical protein
MYHYTFGYIVETDGEPLVPHLVLLTPPYLYVKVCYFKPCPYENEPERHREDAGWVGWAIRPQAISPQPYVHPRDDD